MPVIKPTAYSPGKNQSQNSGNAGKQILFPPFSYQGSIREGAQSGRLYFNGVYMLTGYSLSGQEGSDLTEIDLYVGTEVISSIELEADDTYARLGLGNRVRVGDYAWVDCVASGGHRRIVVQLYGYQIQ